METLTSTAYRKTMDLYKNEPEFKVLMENPVFKNLIQTINQQRSKLISKTIKQNIEKNIEKFQHEIQLIHSILLVFNTEQDATMDLLFSRKNTKMSLWLEPEEKSFLSYHIRISRNDIPWHEFVFWNQKDFEAKLIDIFYEKMPKKIVVYRSVVSVERDEDIRQPIKKFIKKVNNLIDDSNPSKSLIKHFHTRTLQLPQLGIRPLTVFK